MKNADIRYKFTAVGHFETVIRVVLAEYPLLYTSARNRPALHRVTTFILPTKSITP
jgi:hypothetical protein